MNKIHRLVRHRETGAWVPVPEITRARGKSNNRRLLSLGSTAALTVAASFGIAIPSLAAEFVIDDGMNYVVPGSHTSPWNDSSVNMIVGDTGVGGRLSIGDGSNIGQVRNATSWVGRQAGSSGKVTVTGAGSLWAVDYTSAGAQGHLYVGGSGTGDVLVNNGAALTATRVHLGLNSGSEGTLVVAGAGSTMNSHILVGEGGKGRLTISNGAVLTSGLSLSPSSYIGGSSDVAGGNGEVLITGRDSAWNATVGSLWIGLENSTGALTVADGGKFHHAGTLTSVGSEGTGRMLITGQGSEIEIIDNNFYVAYGSASDGTLTVADGGTAYISAIGGVTSAGVEVGSKAGAQGRIDVSGAGSTLNFASKDGSTTTFVTLGQAGAGEIAVRDGGALNVSGSLVAGYKSGSTGTVTVSGNGSSMTVADRLSLGGQWLESGGGTGSLVVSDGGTLQAKELLVGAGGTGTATVSGVGSILSVEDALSVGVGNAGQMRVENGGRVHSAEANIGYYPLFGSSGNGSVLVAGDGSEWINDGDMRVGGAYASGELTVADGASVQNAGVIQLGTSRGASQTATVNIGNGGRAGALSAAQIVDDVDPAAASQAGTVNFNHTDDIDFSTQLSGRRLVVNHVNTGTTRLTTANDYGGQTTISSGTLQAGAVNVLSTASTHVIEAGGTLDLANHDQILGSLSNGGTVQLSTADHGGTTLTVNDYVGNGGTLVFNSVLDGDSSNTDRLVAVNTRGTSNVRIVNVGGTGMQTAQGIEIIQVTGASDGVFNLQGRAVAGAYEYFLHEGNGGDGWYLRSQVNDGGPVNPGTPGGGDGGGGNSGGVVDPPVLRSEVAGYLNNQIAALSMFKQSMHERMGEPGLNGMRDQNARGGAWVRARSGKLDAGVIGHQLDVETDMDVMQGGADMQFGVGADGRLHLGAMGGYGRAQTRSLSQLSSYSTRGEVKGTGLGLYGTWFRNASDPSGLYLDGWVQYGRYDNEIRGVALAREKYDSDSWSGSVEAGYAFPLSQNDHYGIYVEPQVQVIHTRFRGDAHTEANGTRVARQRSNDTTTRLGARVFGRSLDAGSNRVQPFAAVNWWSGGDDASVRMNEVRTRHRIAEDRYEVRVGAQAELGSGWSAWGSFGTLWGSNDFRDYDGQLGLKYGW